MRKKTSALLMLLLLATLLVPLASTAPPSPQAINQIQARTEMYYETVLMRLQLPAPVKTVEFNVSRVADRVLAAFVDLGGRYVKGQIVDGRLVFQLPSPSSKINITVLFGRIYKIRGENVTLSFPLPLSPIGYNTSVRGTLEVRASRVEYGKTNIGKPKGNTLYINATLPGGKTVVVNATSKTYFIILASISELKRTIIIHKGWAEYRDNITVVNIAEYPFERLALRMPSEYEVLGVEGPLGPYPRRYWRIGKSRDGKFQLLLISLISPPEGMGQKTSIVVKLRVNKTSTLDAYLGYGIHVDNYTVNICVDGSASVNPTPLRTYRQGAYTCYVLPRPGPLVVENYYKPVTVQATVREEGNIPYPLIALTVITAVLLGGYAYVYSKRGRARRALASVEEDKISEIGELLSRREDLYRNLVERLREMRAKKVGTTKMIRAIRESARRDERLAQRIRQLASTLGEDGERLVAEMERVSGEINGLLRRLEKTERAFRSGRMSREEYKDEIARIEREIEEKAVELASLIRILEA